MTTIRILLSVGLLSLAAAAHAGAQSADANISLQQTLESRRQSAATAWQKKDADALKDIMAPDFLFVSPQGTVTREGWLASLAHCSLTSFTMGQVHAHIVSPESATLSYNLHYVGDCDGTSVPSYSKVTDTFAHREGKWWIVKTIYMPSPPTVASAASAIPSISEAQKTFDTMKSLAGTWQGSITTDNPAWSTDKLLPLSIRVASHGNALIHELSTPGPEVTVFYLDSDRLVLLHYCDFGNRPHLVARPSPNGKTVEFDLVDAPGSNQVGHVNHAVFTIIDPNHHIEDWTLALANGTLMHGHVDFKRVQ